MESMASYLGGLLKLSGQGAILIVLVLVAQRICGRRLQPRWRCALWLLVLARLALPWTITSPTSVFNTVNIPSLPAIAGTKAPVGGMAEDLSDTAEDLAASKAIPTGRHWFAWVWGVGAVVLLGFMGWNQVCFHRRVSRRRLLVDERALNLLEDCRGLMGVRAPVILIETDAVQEPTLYGFVRPRLLLPEGMVSGFSAQELRHVFLHELAHVKRHDILIGWVMLLLQTLHWFNPLVWLAAHRLRVDRELACDALALSRVRPGENESYGLTIVKLLEGCHESGWAPGLAGILEDRKQMKERISMIAQFKRTNRGLALAASLFAGLALATLTDAQSTSRASATQNSEGGSDAKMNVEEQVKQAQSGNQWAMYRLWDAYYRGTKGVQRNPEEAQKWLKELVKDAWVVRFEPTGDFAPKNPGQFLGRINQYAKTFSGKNNMGQASFFRTTKQGDKLVGSFLSSYPDELKAGLAKVPNLKVTSVERITPEQFIKYDESKQESLAGAPREELVLKHREQFNKKMAQDRAKYTQEQLREAEGLYQVANKQWGTSEATASLQKMITKYPDINRTGCAVLYVAQHSRGDKQIGYLQDCIEKYNDCYYGDGVQVGMFARFLLAGAYTSKGENGKAEALYDELRTKFSDAVDHGGNLLIDSIKAEAK